MNQLSPTFRTTANSSQLHGIGRNVWIRTGTVRAEFYG